METVNYYIPSESQIILDTETANVQSSAYHFMLWTDTFFEKLFLNLQENLDCASEEVPDEICQKICRLHSKNQLTHAAVNQLLTPLKQSLIRRSMQDQVKTHINVSQILATARGYVIKDGKPIAIFTRGSLSLNQFDDVFSLRFTIAAEDTSKVAILTSREYMLRSNEHSLFVLYTDFGMYEVTATVDKEMFYLQHITEAQEMLHQDMFKAEMPLYAIIKRFTERKSRLSGLLNKQKTE